MRIFSQAAVELWPALSLAYADAPQCQGPTALGLDTVKKNYGCFTVVGDIDSLPADDRQLLDNALNLLALLLERLDQQEQLRDRKQALEAEVVRRTADLEARNRELVEEVARRERTEAALKKSEEQLLNAVTIAKLGHWELDLQTGQFTFSDSFFAIFRTSAAEMGGNTMSVEEYSNRFVHPDDRLMVAEETAKALASSDPQYHRYLEHRFLAADGTVGYLAVNYFIVKDAGGKSVKSYGVNQDITERVRSEQALRESEMRFKALHNASFGGIAIHDKGIILDCNLGLTEMFGYSQDELIGMNGLLLIAESSRQNVMNNILAGYEKPYEEYGIRKNGEEFPMRLEARNIPYKDKIVRVVEFRDITESRNAARALLAAKNAAEAANHAKSEFLANMSHEIRTPLNGILGMLQLMGTTSMDGEQQEYLRAAIKSSTRLTRLLADILDLSKIEAGKLSLNLAAFKVDALKRSVLELFELTAKAQNTELAFQVSEAMPCELVGDETRLRQILLNLVGNAIKFAPDGRVSVEISPLPAKDQASLRVLFIVRDSGIGIPDDLLKAIFEPFTQAEESYTRRFQGAGLGLSIVKKLVAMMGGELAVDNTQGNGTTMYLSLPLGLPLESDNQAGQSADGLGDRTTGPLWVLLADDDEVSVVASKRMLEKSGLGVVAATTGVEVLQLLERQPFDLILMDIQMPRMDGVEATRRIRAGEAGLGNRSIPIIATTAYAMTGDREKFLNAGMDAYIAKPVDMDELKEVIRRVSALKKTA